jgi:hypothetical protein
VVLPYFTSLSWKLSATSPNPSCGNWSSIIWSCQNLTLHYCTM